MEHPFISFIGGGNMAQSLIGGLRQNGWPADKLAASEPDTSKHEQLRSKFGIQIEQSNAIAADMADIVVLAVKPQVMKTVMQDLKAHCKRAAKMYISIAAGVPTSSLENWYSTELAIVRAMPNTPALLGCGATGLYANERVSAQLKQQAETIMTAVGTVTWVTEEVAIDKVTALSGSGPAYFFLMIESMIAAAEKLGLDSASAAALAKQTAYGAAKMALESDEAPATLRKNVTSPGGTTERALSIMNEKGFQDMMQQAIEGAFTRSQELASALEKE